MKLAYHYIRLYKEKKHSVTELCDLRYLYVDLNMFDKLFAYSKKIILLFQNTNVPYFHVTSLCFIVISQYYKTYYRNDIFNIPTVYYLG